MNHLNNIFSKKNVLVLVLFILSLIGMLAYFITLSYPVLSFLDYNLGNILHQIFLRDIPVGIIITCVFYICNIYFPERDKHNKQIKIIKNKIDTILSEINILFLYLYPNFTNSTELSSDYFNKELVLRKNKMNLKYEVKGNHGKYIPFSTGDYTEIDFFKNSRDIISSKIDEIFIYPGIVDMNGDVINILYMLKNSSFLGFMYSSYKLKDIGDNFYFKGNLYEFYQLYRKLGNYGDFKDIKLR